MNSPARSAPAPIHARPEPATMSAGRSLGLLLMSAAGAWALHTARGALAAPPVSEPQQLHDWWLAVGTGTAALSIARVAGLALCCYLALIASLGAVAGLTRWRWTLALTVCLSTPGLRRAVAGGGLAMALASTAAPAAASVAVYSVSDIGPAATARLGVAGTRSAPPSDDSAPAPAPAQWYTISDIGPSPGHGHSIIDIGPSPALGYTITDTAPSPAHAHSITDTAPTVRAQLGVASARPSPVGGESTPDTKPAPAPAQWYTIADVGSAPAKAETRANAETRTAAENGPTNRALETSPPGGHPASQADATAPHTGPVEPSMRSRTASMVTTEDTTAPHTGPVEPSMRSRTASMVTTADATAPHTGPVEPSMRSRTASMVTVADATARDTWLVEPGDHLWGIAAETLARRAPVSADTDGGEPSADHMSVLRYWLRLIEANTDTVGDNPDLIHPGQIIRLPA